MLDNTGVFRVDRIDGPSWMARLFRAARPMDGVEGDAEILRFLAKRDFPAERCAHPEPVSIHDGQGVLVTEYIDGPMLAQVDADTFRVMLR
jgi:hypothetical protein